VVVSVTDSESYQPVDLDENGEMEYVEGALKVDVIDEVENIKNMDDWKGS
jgi:hypothetical protein